VLGLASLGSYGVIYAGWASNSKYALLGAFRAVAQFVSYEIIFSVLFLPLLAASGSANLLVLVQQQQLLGWFSYLVPLWLLSFLVVLAETNRTPFDLPEAEAELVAGFNVEYSSLLFAFFFLAEYSSMGFFAALLVTLFFGGYSLPFGAAAPVAPLVEIGYPLLDAPEPLQQPSLGELLTSLAGFSGEVLLLVLKVQLVCLAFIWVRASLPRKRFDQLVLLCWKYLFPLALSLALALVALLQAFQLAALPTAPSLLPEDSLWLGRQLVEDRFFAYDLLEQRYNLEPRKPVADLGPEGEEDLGPLGGLLEGMGDLGDGSDALAGGTYAPLRFLVSFPFLTLPPSGEW
jgi:NADH-ubiquinone oxidoreductase chain 1